MVKKKTGNQSGRPTSEDKMDRDYIYFRKSEVKEYGGWKSLKKKIYAIFKKKE